MLFIWHFSSYFLIFFNYIISLQDGEMVPYTKELGDKIKHSLRQVGKKYIFSVRDLMPDDAGLYQLDVDDVNMFSTDFKSKFYTFTQDKLVHSI